MTAAGILPLRMAILAQAGRAKVAKVAGTPLLAWSAGFCAEGTCLHGQSGSASWICATRLASKSLSLHGIVLSQCKTMVESSRPWLLQVVVSVSWPHTQVGLIRERQPGAPAARLSWS